MCDNLYARFLSFWRAYHVRIRSQKKIKMVLNIRATRFPPKSGTSTTRVKPYVSSSPRGRLLREGKRTFCLKKVVEKVFSKSVEILFIQYLFSVKLNAEKMKEDKLKISVFSIIAFFIANNMSKEEWTRHETVFALLGGFR